MHSCHSLCSERGCRAGQSRLGTGCVISERRIQLRRRALQPIAAIVRSKSMQRSSTAVPTEEDSAQERHRTSHAISQDNRVDPRSLFPVSHVEQLYPLLVLYFPFGVAIAAVRMLMWVALLLTDQAWLTDNNKSIAVLQFILGVDVEWRHAQLIPEERHVLVSNHITVGDLMVLYRRPRRIVHLISTGLPKRVAEARHHRVDLRHACLATYDQLSQPSERDSIHLFPEGGMTDGKGMMKFSRGFLRFAEGLPVVPVALRAELPWGISTHTLNSSFLSNLFWFCFSPYVKLQMTVLPPVERSEEESKAKFVERIQENIATELQVPVLDITIQAKKNLVQTSAKKGH